MMDNRVWYTRWHDARMTVWIMAWDVVGSEMTSGRLTRNMSFHIHWHASSHVVGSEVSPGRLTRNIRDNI